MNFLQLSVDNVMYKAYCYDHRKPDRGSGADEYGMELAGWEVQER